MITILDLFIIFILYKRVKNLKKEVLNLKINSIGKYTMENKYNYKWSLKNSNFTKF